MRISDWSSDVCSSDLFAANHIRSAMNCWLRAANYFREAEFWLAADDPRRLPTFDRCENASHKFLKQLTPTAEIVDIPYEPGKPLPARSEEHTSELQSLMRLSYDVFCLKTKNKR